MSEATKEHSRPDASLTEFGNDQPCRRCGAAAGKQCIKADSSYRDYPHQVRRDDADRFQKFNGGQTIGDKEQR